MPAELKISSAKSNDQDRLVFVEGVFNGYDFKIDLAGDDHMVVVVKNFSLELAKEAASNILYTGHWVEAVSQAVIIHESLQLED